MNTLLTVTPLLAAAVAGIPEIPTHTTLVSVSELPRARAEGEAVIKPLMVTTAIEQGVDVGGVRWKVNLGSSNVGLSWLFRF